VPITRFFEAQHYQHKIHRLDGVHCLIIESPKIKNAIPHKALTLGYKILDALGHQPSEALVVPTESHVYILANKDIIGISSEYGLEQYQKEKAHILTRHQHEDAIGSAQGRELRGGRTPGPEHFG
jgi:hypothetical protein